MFVALILAASPVAESALLPLALSFWHYYLYLLAYRFGAVAPDTFRRDAVFMKAVALVTFAGIYFRFPVDYLSLAVVGIGFLVNFAGALALGPVRTYYGSELLDLPDRPVTGFPYSLLSHPMLIGNITAFGGTLLNPGFCQAEWPLAAAHVALNVGLLHMERTVTPLRRFAQGSAPHPATVCRAKRFAAGAFGLSAGLLLLSLVGGMPDAVTVAVTFLAGAYAGVKYVDYALVGRSADTGLPLSNEARGPVE